MSTQRTSARRKSRSLTLDQIVDAAFELLEEGGLNAVTIRAVAERCNVGAMTLYTYVGTKEGLLAGMVSRHLQSIELPAPKLPWRERVIAIFRGVHDLFLEHPELARIAASQPIDNAAAFRGAEAVLAALRVAGLTDQEAVDAFDALAAYVVGFTRREVSRSTNYIPPAERLRELRRLPEAEFPHVRAMAEPFATRDAGRRFDGGLQLLISGIAAKAT